MKLDKVSENYNIEKIRQKEEIENQQSKDIDNPDKVNEENRETQDLQEEYLGNNIDVEA